MPKLQSKNKLYDALRVGYEDRAVPMLPSYPVKTIIKQMEVEIDQLSKIVTGPLYYGEAEQLLLDPLASIAQEILSIGEGKGYVVGAVVKAAYAKASQYSVLAQVARVAATKEVADKMSAEAIKATPIYIALKGKLQEEQSTGKDKIPVWSLIYNFIKEQTASDVIGNLLRVEGSTLEPESLDKTYTTISRVMRTGKGFWLTPENRVAVLEKRAMVRAALTHIMSLLEASASQTAAQDDALTLAYWYLVYLRSCEKYDSTFPAGEFTAQSQAWVMSVRSTTTRMAECYTDIALLSYSFSVRIAVRLYESTREFFKPLLLSQSALDDLQVVFDDALGRFSRVAPKYALDAADDAFDTLKNYANATHILPASYTNELAELLANVELKYSVEASEIYSATGIASFQQLLLTRSSEKMSSLLVSAANIADAIDFLTRAKSILRLQFEGEATSFASITNLVSYQRHLQVRGSVGNPVPADFTVSDPITISYDKWKLNSKQENEWTLQQYMFTPVRSVPMAQHLVNASPRILWPTIGSVAIGDPITAAYATMPIPFAYTATRNRSRLSYDMSTLYYLLRGRNSFNPLDEVFGTAATLIVQHFEQYGQLVVNYLASICHVYVKKGSSAPELKSPNCPTIYGMPLKAFQSANTYSANKLSAMIDADQAVAIAVKDAKGVATTVTFALHQKYPVMRATLPIAYSPVKGAVIMVPVMSDTYRAAQILEKDAEGRALSRTVLNADRVAALDVNDLGYEKDIWTDPKGFAPFLVTLPHLLFEVQSSESLVRTQDFYKYSIASISRKVESDTGDLTVAGFVENPIVIYDMDDMVQALESEDPSPLDTTNATISAPESIIGGEEVKTTPSGSTTVTPTTVSSPISSVIAGESASKVATAPIIHEAAVDKMVVENNKEKVVQAGTPIVATTGSGPDEDQKPLSGSPSSSADATVVTNSTTPKSKKFFKKVEDGVTVDVKAIEEGEEVPSGYIPASETEWIEFVKKSEQ